MKKILFCIVAIAALSISSASAQQKGDMSVNANLGLGISAVAVDGSSATAVEFGIGAEFGYFVADKLKIGVGFAYDVVGGDDATHAFGIGPSLSYYVTVCKNLYYAPKLDLAFCIGANDGESIPGFGLGLALANFEFRPTEHIGLSASLLSLDYVLLSKYGVNINNVDFSLSLSPKLGFAYYF